MTFNFDEFGVDVALARRFELLQLELLCELMKPSENDSLEHALANFSASLEMAAATLCVLQGLDVDQVQDLKAVACHAMTEHLRQKLGEAGIDCDADRN